jgi:hypothetical protein
VGGLDLVTRRGEAFQNIDSKANFTQILFDCTTGSEASQGPISRPKVRPIIENRISEIARRP